jgi:DMSO/TMAO reductase YedYZ molybdopterin-dependent catalytic subunit
MKSQEDSPQKPKENSSEGRAADAGVARTNQAAEDQSGAPKANKAPVNAASESAAKSADPSNVETKNDEHPAETVQRAVPNIREINLIGPRMTERQFRGMSRRELLKVMPLIALGAFAIPGAQEWLLKKGLGFSDWTSARLFRRGHLAPTFADSAVAPFEKFPINGYDVDDPGVIFENWTLTVSGTVQKPGDYKLDQIQTLPRIRQNTRHICVEGWDVIGRFGGARLSDFLNMIGADTSARFITVGCADDYYESLDMATALHPQTLLCYEMYDRPLTREHGAPLRLQIPTKVGYKQAKYLTDLKVTNVLNGKVGYWEDQGYSEFYGL